MVRKSSIYVLGFVAAFMILSFHLVGAYGDADADIRVIHAVPDAGQVDFYLNDIFAGTLSYGEAAQYIIVAPGDITLRAFTPGSGPSGTPIFESAFSASNDQTINAVVEGSSSSINLAVYNVNRSPLPMGRSRVNLIHALSGLDAGDITIEAADGTAIANEKLEYGENAAFDLSAGTYTIRLGNALEKTLSFNAGTAYSVLILGTADASNVGDVRVFSGGTMLGDPAGYMRIVHVLPDVPAVDLYLNDTLIAPNLEFGESTTYIALPAGTYTAALYPAGALTTETAPLTQIPVQIAVGIWITELISGNVATPIFTPFIDDLSAVPEGQSRLTIYNAEAEPIEVALNDTVVIDRLAPDALSAPVLVTSDPQTLMITTGDAESIDLDYSVSPNTAFNLRTVILADGTPIVLSACSLPPA